MTQNYTYPAEGGGVINEVTYVENAWKPSLLEYAQSIPLLLTNGSTSLPKPVGADTKVVFRVFRVFACACLPGQALPCLHRLNYVSMMCTPGSLHACS
jgi:hypothetical protein